MSDRYSEMRYKEELENELNARDIPIPDWVREIKDQTKLKEEYRKLLRKQDDIDKRAAEIAAKQKADQEAQQAKIDAQQKEHYRVYSRNLIIGLGTVIVILFVGFVTFAVWTIVRNNSIINSLKGQVQATSVSLAEPTVLSAPTLYPVQPTYTPYPTQVPPTEYPTATTQPTDVVFGMSSPVAVTSGITSTLTWKFDFPDAGVNSGDGWSISGLPTKVDPANVLVASGMFKNTVGLGSQSWIAEPGTKLVGPDYPADKAKAEGGSTEYFSPINQKLIDESGEDFHLNEDRIDFCSFGGAKLEFNGVQAVFDYKPGHNYFLIIRGLFPDGKQDTDRNHTILFSEVVGSHAQCMSFPGNGGGFISEGEFLQTAELSHNDAMDCGAEGCSGLTVVFVDLNTGALSVINQAQLGQPWTFVSSNWLIP
jgi:hypothetical protein